MLKAERRIRIRMIINYVTGDSIDHLNVYSKSKTELGRMLSNFFKCQIETPFGMFNSIEGYWQWLLLPSIEDKDVLKYLHGYKAKSKAEELFRIYGREYNYDENEFKHLINDAVNFKMHKYFKIILNADKFYDLPLTHYVLKEGHIIDYTDKFYWWLQNMETTRRIILETNGIVM